MIIYEQHRANPHGGIYHQWNTELQFYPHLHDSFELIFVEEGRLELTVDETPFSVCAGQAILIFPNQIHAASNTQSTKTYLCIFENSLVGEFYRIAKKHRAENPVFDVKEPEKIARLVGAEASRYGLKSYLYDIIARFDEVCGAYLPRSGKSTELLGKILVFISAHYDENITMRRIAAELGYDHRYLSNLLQKHLHTTFRAILNEYRISQAKHLLAASSDSISDIAYACGYESVVSFNRNFRNLVNMTPSDYREKG